MLASTILEDLTPAQPPQLSQLLRELGRPSPAQLSKAFHVSRSTAYRWVTADEAPRAVLIALYWMSHKGRNDINEFDFKRASAAYEAQRSLERENKKLVREFARVLSAADFGCANDVTSEPIAWAIEAERRQRPLKLIAQ